MNPAFIDGMSWEMAEVYGAISDRILINLARYFPYWKAGDKLPRSAFEYQARMLAQMGKVNADTVRIIRNSLEGVDDALKNTLEQAIIEAVKKAQPELLEGVKAGILKPNGIPIVAPNQMRAFSLYYQQASNKLNLVNTVMLESTNSAYIQAVSDVVSEISIADSMNRIQIALDTAAGETITGVSSWNEALRHATQRMTETGITGFVDHGGHHWSAEAYTAMGIRTTVANTARAATWETNQDFGNDLYQVSYHDGARPKCYPWQNKVISSTDNARVTYDLDGNEITVYAQSETSYGEAAGLFGINCKHYPSPFIPGVSIVRGEPQSEEENAKTYAESQEQRRLERKLREEKRDLAMAKAQGAPEDEIKRLRDKTRKTSQDIDDFCEQTGRARHRDREAVYTKREFPDKNKYDVTKFEHEQQDTIKKYFENGGEQQGYKFGELTPNEPITPATPTTSPTPETPVVSVAQTPAYTMPEMPTEKSNMIKMFERNGATPLPFKTLDRPLADDEIIAKLSGADKTKGSCASLGLAYAGNKAGYDVTDFRGGKSQYVFSRNDTLRQIARFDGVDGVVVKNYNDFKNAHELLTHVEPGHEYFFTAGKHAAIVRKVETGFEYLEMQSGHRENTWYALNDTELRYRFGCQRSHTTYGMKYEVSDCLFDVDKVKGSGEFAQALEYLNTEPGQQRKGVGGGQK
jgi:hypothetical protein